MALGYNEFVSILKNPIYLIGIVLIGAILYALYVTNLLKPAIRVGKVIIQDVWLQINNFYNETKVKKHQKMDSASTSNDSISYLDDDIALSKLNRRKNKNNYDSNATLVNF